MNKRGGFTIVELLIVIVVIAVLAAISIIAYNGVVAKSYVSRAQNEMASIADAVRMFHVENSRYPADVERNVPAEIAPMMSGGVDRWPLAPWPGSVYDYDYFTDSVTGEDYAQVSIRFCPLGGTGLTGCKFPSDDWAADFQRDSSYYWCIKGQCRPHPSRPITYPGKCANCRT